MMDLWTVIGENWEFLEIHDISNPTLTLLSRIRPVDVVALKFRPHSTAAAVECDLYLGLASVVLPIRR